jgi:cobalt/nickel transport system permease protein
LHIPDGYLGPYTYGGLWVAIVPIWIYASRRIKEIFKASRIPFLALSAAFSFVVMMFNVPLPGGTTGHATGATLIAILLGPWPAVIAVSIALIIQAIIFGDGGITALGANCFNIGFAGAVVGYGIYRTISSSKFKVQSSKLIIQDSYIKETPNSELRTRHLIGAGIGAYTGINISALLTAFELGLQPLLHVGPDGRPLYSPFPLGITIPSIMIVHIFIFGILEAIVTVLVLMYIQRSHPELIRG